MQRETPHINHNTTGELPCLILRRIKALSDFKVEEFNLEVRGWNMEECIVGLDILIDRLNKLPENERQKTNKV